MTVEKTDFIILEFNYSRNAKSFLRLNQPSMWSLIQNFLCVLAVIIHRRERKFWFYLKTDARFRCCSTHVPNLTNEFSTAREWRSESIWYGRFSLVRPFVELNLGSTSTHAAPYESHFAPVSLQSQSYSVRSGRWKVRRLFVSPFLIGSNVFANSS